LDWTNERYVRVYVRDTGDLLAVGWEGRAVLWEMMRKAERNGVVDAEEDTLAELLRMPREMVATGLGRLLTRGVVDEGAIQGSPVYVIPNFMEAQESVQSDKQRQAELRARRRAMALEVTKRDAPVTKRDETVTPGHAESRAVTPCLAVPSRAVPDRADPDTSTSPKSQPSEARRVFDFWVTDTGKTKAKFISKRRTRIESRLREGYTVDELCAAIRNRRNDSHLMGQNDRGTVYDGISTLLRDGEQVERLRDLTEAPRPNRGQLPLGRPTKAGDLLAGQCERVARLRAEEEAEEKA
jgi:cobalamin biosynthesis Mg chelatase CobN